MERKLHVPLDTDWDGEKPIWQVGFETVYANEEDVDQDVVWFEYQGGTLGGSQWDHYSVAVHLKKRTVKGSGSRKHREFILSHVLYWYLKAIHEEKYEDLLH